MATQTQHFNLTKPDWEDRASISVLNANTDIIDAQMYDNEQSALNAIGNMAAEYDDTATYEVGDFCIYSEVLYKCVTAVTVAEAFDSTKWTQTTAAENFGSGGGGGSATLAGLNDVNLTSPTDGQALVYDATNQEWVNGAGGGGNANERVLTRAEYEALTDAEKLNGTTYYINDAVPEGKEIQPVIYSTEEREVGVWADGKPLYQKTIIKDNPTISNTFENIYNINNLETLVNSFGNFQRNNVNGLMYSFNGSTRPETTNNNPFVSVRYYNGNIQCAISTTPFIDVTKIFITIQYTKTTDTAGSGVWTTSGVPAVHYSTDEQIVGTWIDGSTIYEKTFSLNGITSSNTNLIDISGLNIDSVIDLSGYVNGTEISLKVPIYDSASNLCVLFVNKSTGYIRGRLLLGSGSYVSGYVTIRYTKSA